jgi:hypothetical protein
VAVLEDEGIPTYQQVVVAVVLGLLLKGGLYPAICRPVHPP